jgi:hypothetical protein
MLEELLYYIDTTFEVDPEAGQVLEKATGRLLTATKFQTLPLTAKEVVWAYSQRALPVGIMLRDPDRRVRRFALDNLEPYDEGSDEKKLFTSMTQFRLAWAYWPGRRPVLVELVEYRVTSSLVKLSPLNWRYSEFGRDQEELARFQQTRRELRNTNLKENSYWEVPTTSLRLVRDVRSIAFGRWIRTARHKQTLSHLDGRVTIHQPNEVKLRTARPNKKRGKYAQERLAEYQAQAEHKARQEHAVSRKVRNSPLQQYVKEALFPSPIRREFDQRMAKWIANNTLGDSQFTP